MPRPAKQISKADITWSTIHQYLLENHHLELKREQIASHFNITPNYLSTLCRNKTSRHLHDHLQEIKLNRAFKLLQEPNLSVSQVAHLCHFSNSSYFIRCFKAKFGQSPGKMKRLP